jgi:hypothetical protein
MKLTAQQWLDRAEAWLSCADHLQLDWTDDPGERDQGKAISDFCRRKYDECMDRAADLSNDERIRADQKS